MNATETKTVAKGYGTVTLPPGMTQEEADRLVREADNRNKTQETN